MLIAECILGAAAVRKPMAISVCDQGGALKSFLRMDGAPLLSVEIAHNKAYTAAAFGVPTHAWFDVVKDDEPLRLGFVHTPRLVTFGGGYPIMLDGELIGAIGVSGGHYTDDMAIAEEAIRSVGLTVFEFPGLQRSDTERAKPA